MKRLLPYLLSIVLPAVAWAQGSVQHYTTSNGLSHDITYGMLQDKDGYIWIGTDDGVARFDGQDFEVVNSSKGLNSSFVVDIAQTDEGRIFVTTWGGGIYEVANGNAHKPEPELQESDKINNLKAWGNHLLAKHSSGNVLYQKDKEGYVKKSMVWDGQRVSIVEFIKFRRGLGLLELVKKDLLIYNGINEIYSYTHPELRGVRKVNPDFSTSTVFPELRDKVVHCVSDLGGNSYLVSSFDSVFVFEGNQLVQRASIDLDGFTGVHKAMPLGTDSLLLLFTNTKGFKNAYLLSRKDFKTKVNFKKSLQTKATISYALIDHEQNIWISTYGEGVYCVRNNSNALNVRTYNELKESIVMDIKEQNGELLVLTPNYLNKLIHQKIQSQWRLAGLGKKISLPPKGLPLVSSLIFTEKPNPLNPFMERNSFTAFHLKEPAIEIVVSDSIQFSGKFSCKLIKNDLNINDAVYFNDTLWLATNEGTYYLDPAQCKITRGNIGGANAYPKDVHCFAKSGNSLWIGTANGLYLLTAKAGQYQTEQIEDLNSNHINALLLDSKGKLWIGTKAGVSIRKTGETINLPLGDGLSQLFIKVILEDAEGQIWLGSNNGLFVLENHHELRLQPAPLLLLEPNQNTFAYKAISYNRPNSLQVAYRLNSGEWTALPNDRGTVRFDSLPQGNYQVQFRARKIDGQWAYAGPYDFQVKTVWSKGTWTVVLLTFAFTSIISLLIFMQLQSVKKRNTELRNAIAKQRQLEQEITQVRESIAQDFHDDLGNKLARISLLSNMMTKDLEDKERLQLKLAQIQADANYLYRGTRDFIFSLKEDSNYLEELVTYLSDFGEDFFQHSSLKFVVEKNIEQNIKLPYYWSKQLIFIFKEAMTNVLKHSSASTVVLRFEYRDGKLQMSCTDDGIGLVLPQNGKGSGIKSMAKRAEKIGGELRFSQQAPQGTKVAFSGVLRTG